MYDRGRFINRCIVSQADPLDFFPLQYLQDKLNGSVNRNPTLWRLKLLEERECAVWISSGLSSNIFHIKFWCVRLCAHVSISFGLLQRDFAILHCISCITIAQQWLWYQSWWMTMMMHFANVAWNVIHCNALFKNRLLLVGSTNSYNNEIMITKNIILYMFYFEFIINNNHTVFFWWFEEDTDGVGMRQLIGEILPQLNDKAILFTMERYDDELCPKSKRNWKSFNFSITSCSFRFLFI